MENPQPQDNLVVNDDQIKTILNQAAERRQAAFNGFLRLYAQSHPKQQYQRFAKWGIASIIALAATVASATGLALAAAYNEELTSFFSFLGQTAIGITSAIIAALAILGFEGYMITMGIMKGVAAGDDEEKRKIFRNREIAAIIILVISVTAGIFQRSFLIENEPLRDVLSVALMVTAGIGAPIAVWLASPVLGNTLNFPADLDEQWMAKAQEAFDQSDAATLAQRELEMQLARLKREEKREIKAEKQQGQPAQASQPQQAKLPSSSQILDWYLNQTGLTIQDDIKAKVVAEEWANSAQFNPVNGELDRLATAIRVNLRRRRQD